MRFFYLARVHARIAGRQRALWVTSLLFTLLSLSITVNTGLAFETNNAADLAFLGQSLALFPPIAYVAAFTDLISAPSRLDVGEIEDSAPIHPVELAAARIFGSLFVMTLPSAAMLLFCGVAQTLLGNMWGVPQSILLFVSVVGPAALLATALSACVGALLPRAIARVVALVAWCLALGLTLFVAEPVSGGGVQLHLASDAICQAFFGCGPLLDQASATGVACTPAEAILLLAIKPVLAVALLVAASVVARNRSFKRG